MDTFDYREFLSKNRLGPYAKTGKINENYVDLRPINEMDGEISRIEDIPARAPKADPGPQPEPIEIISMGSNGATIKVRKPDGTEEDVEFELDGDIEEVDPPYGYEGTIYGEIDGVEYGIPVSLVKMGGGSFDMDLSDGLFFVEGKEPNQQEDEDGDEVTHSESWHPDGVDPDEYDDISEDDTAGSDDDTSKKANAYKRFMDALEIILGLWKQGDIAEDEKVKIISAAYDTFKRLQKEAGK